MANSTSPVPQVAEGTGAVAKINQIFDMASQSMIGGRDATTTSLLTWGYLGGRISGVDKASGTITLTASTTNYIVMAKAGLAVSVSTATTNWNDSTNYWRLYSVVTNATTVTSYNDERLGTGGLFALAGSTAFTGGTLTSALNEAPPVTIASAASVAIGAAASNTVLISGTTTITSFDSIAAGAIRHVRFLAALTLTHNATSLILPAGANITTAAGDVAVVESLGSGNWRCQVYAKADGTALVAGGASLNNWTESIATGAPNATVPVASFTATNAASNVDAAIVPKAQGALLTRIPDNATSGGNKRGINAVDFQMSRSAATQVASGIRSFIGNGAGNTASATESVVAGGNGNLASASQSVVSGGANGTASGANSGVTNGQNATADASFSRAGGYGSTTNGIIGADAYAANAVNDKSQHVNYHLSRQTTDATPTVLTADAGAGSTNNQVVLPNASTYAFVGYVSARTSGNLFKAWKFEGCISRGAGAGTTVVGAAITPTVLGMDGSNPAWSIAVTADTTNGGIAVTATGAAATTIKWSCLVTTAECKT